MGGLSVSRPGPRMRRKGRAFRERKQCAEQLLDELATRGPTMEQAESRAGEDEHTGGGKEEEKAAASDTQMGQDSGKLQDIGGDESAP